MIIDRERGGAAVKTVLPEMRLLERMSSWIVKCGM